MRLILIRHLPTNWNAKGLLQGRRDTHILDPVGETLAAIDRNRQALDRQHFDHVLASRLSRTQETARDVRFPSGGRASTRRAGLWHAFEGKPKHELEKWQGGLWYDNPRSLTLGESVANLEGRVRAFTAKYASAASVLAFSHGAWGRALLSLHTYGNLRLI